MPSHSMHPAAASRHQTSAEQTSRCDTAVVMLCVCEPARYTVIDLFLPKFSCSRWHQTCSVFLLPRQAQDRNLYIMLALEAAIAAEPQFIPARIALALIDDHADRESAIAQYRASLTDRPNDPRTQQPRARTRGLSKQSRRGAADRPARNCRRARRSGAPRWCDHLELLLAGHIPARAALAVLARHARVRAASAGSPREAANTIREALASAAALHQISGGMRRSSTLPSTICIRRQLS